ncbi:hypothetical protein [uncultured Eubacterium sp.]|uniref:hypothetical protein n=1 Tax=uncultured Eubacterium sp. TaxID=165185 RepID=UPI0025959880|nr:hypothetical protein [uncultured Eubacterium sp.]
MGTKRNMYTRKELIEQIEQCGQSIIDNAESILGDERYFSHLQVDFQIFRSTSQIPCIEITRAFIPEQQIEDKATYLELKQRKRGNKK